MATTPIPVTVVRRWDHYNRRPYHALACPSDWRIDGIPVERDVPVARGARLTVAAINAARGRLGLALLRLV